MLLFCLLFVLTGTDLLSQSKSELKNSFYDAESWILFEAYRDALPIYLQLAEHYPDNANFKYRIGQCYLNISGAKEKAIPFLEEAVTKIDSLYKEGKPVCKPPHPCGMGESPDLISRKFRGEGKLP